VPRGEISEGTGTIGITSAHGINAGDLVLGRLSGAHAFPDPDYLTPLLGSQDPCSFRT